MSWGNPVASPLLNGDDLCLFCYQKPGLWEKWNWKPMAQTFTLGKYIQPCFALHTKCITLIFLHAFRVMHWICTQNCINLLRTEHFCSSAWLQPIVWGMEPSLTSLQVQLQYFLLNTGKAAHVAQVRGDFQYSCAISLWPIRASQQAQRCKSQFVKSPRCPQSQAPSSREHSSGSKSCAASHMLTAQARL